MFEHKRHLIEPDDLEGQRLESEEGWLETGLPQ
jgi:hypothetical protein